VKISVKNRHKLNSRNSEMSAKRNFRQGKSNDPAPQAAQFNRRANLNDKKVTTNPITAPESIAAAAPFRA